MAAVNRFMDKEIKGLLTGKNELTAEDEFRIFSYYRQYRTQDIRNMIVEKNLGLCRYTAYKFSGFGIDTEELVQEGVIGLMTAVDRFDENMGVKFSTYACCWIRQAIGRCIANTSNAIRFPVHIKEKMMKIQKLQKTYEREYNRKPTVEEAAEGLNLTVDETENIFSLLETAVPSSLNYRLPADSGHDDSELQDFIIDPQTSYIEDDVTRKIVGTEVQKIVNGLEARERDVIRMRFGLDGGSPMTLQEVGSVMGVTRERIRQIEAAAFRKLRKKKNLQGLC